jgi:hypothetical protein
MIGGSNLGVGKKNSGQTRGPPTQWTNLAITPGAGAASAGQGVRLTAYLRLEPQLRMCGTMIFIFIQYISVVLILQ